MKSNNYRCKECGKVVKRDCRSRTTTSVCLETGKYATLVLVPKGREWKVREKARIESAVRTCRKLGITEVRAWTFASVGTIIGNDSTHLFRDDRILHGRRQQMADEINKRLNRRRKNGNNAGQETAPL